MVGFWGTGRCDREMQWRGMHWLLFRGICPIPEEKLATAIPSFLAVMCCVLAAGK